MKFIPITIYFFVCCCKVLLSLLNQLGAVKNPRDDEDIMSLSSIINEDALAESTQLEGILQIAQGD